MSLADELREQQRKEQAKKRYSDEDVYQSILQNSYDNLIQVVKGRASQTETNVISGEFIFVPSKPSLPYDQLINKKSEYHVVASDNDGTEIVPQHICIPKHNKLLGISKISLTEFGKRITDDLIRLGQKDGLTVWFTPDKRLGKKFDVIITWCPSYCDVVLHYEIKI